MIRHVESIESPLEALQSAGRVTGVCFANGNQILYDGFSFARERVQEMVEAADRMFREMGEEGQEVDQLAFGYDAGNLLIVRQENLRILGMHQKPEEIDSLAKSFREFLKDYVSEPVENGYAMESPEVESIFELVEDEDSSPADPSEPVVEGVSEHSTAPQWEEPQGRGAAAEPEAKEKPADSHRESEAEVATYFIRHSHAAKSSSSVDWDRIGFRKEAEEAGRADDQRGVFRGYEMRREPFAETYEYTRQGPPEIVPEGSKTEPKSIRDLLYESIQSQRGYALIQFANIPSLRLPENRQIPESPLSPDDSGLSALEDAIAYEYSKTKTSSEVPLIRGDLVKPPRREFRKEPVSREVPAPRTASPALREVSLPKRQDTQPISAPVSTPAPKPEVKVSRVEKPKPAVKTKPVFEEKEPLSFSGTSVLDRILNDGKLGEVIGKKEANKAAPLPESSPVSKQVPDRTSKNYSGHTEPVSPAAPHKPVARPVPATARVSVSSKIAPAQAPRPEQHDTTQVSRPPKAIRRAPALAQAPPVESPDDSRAVKLSPNQPRSTLPPQKTPRVRARRSHDESGA